MVEEASKIVSSNFPRQSEKIIQYGTAGFRTKGSDLPHVICRMGLLAVLRSKKKGASIGVMITASHNPEEDNGVKLVDPLGEMLEISWEKLSTTVANVSDEKLAEALTGIIEQEKIDMSISAEVICARDTRPSSVTLAEALQCGIEALGGKCINFGLLTTPQLHYMVRCKNTAEAYGKCTENGYNAKMAVSFVKLQNQVSDTGKYTSELTVDAANGVGADKVKQLIKFLGESITINVCNDGTTGKLNYRVGADFVKVNQCSPDGIKLTPGMKCASYDGDADRIVYFFVGTDDKFHLMDGDRIATLVAGYLQNLLKESGLSLNLGLVQTAYANGSSTKYITEKLQVPVACVATGVKHLQAKALDFDIGVYFEANGHGTVLFSDEAESKIRQAAGDASLTESQRKAVDTLCTSIDLINQTVGDAISDMLLVEVILCKQGYDMQEWFECYSDLPNRQLKVQVKDRTVIKTTTDETQATSPDGLQFAIDALVKKYNCARSFVRPSGTEDIVRVYAEADTQSAADSLGHEVCQVVYAIAGGIGERP